MQHNEGGRWKAVWKVEKFQGEVTPEMIERGEAVPYEVVDGKGNLLMYGGVSCLWQYLIGNGTGTGGQTLTYFDNSNTYIGVGDSNTAAAATQTDLQAVTNALRVGMEDGYPAHTDGVISGAATITFRAVFGPSQANFAWEEWGIFNGSSGGRMLNRRVESLGTKASGSTWTFTVTISIS